MKAAEEKKPGEQIVKPMLRRRRWNRSVECEKANKKKYATAFTLIFQWAESTIQQYTPEIEREWKRKNENERTNGVVQNAIILVTFGISSTSSSLSHNFKFAA